MGFRPLVRKLRPGNYVRELSVVILGIFITLTATNYLSNRSKNKEYRQMISMVHAELVENKTKIDNTIRMMEFERGIEKYFYEHREEIDRMPLDTLYKYQYVHHQVEYSVFTNHSLEVLKFSSSVYSNNDPMTIRAIMEAYDNAGICVKYIDLFYSDKEEFINSLADEVGVNFNGVRDQLSQQYHSSAMKRYVLMLLPEELIRETKVASDNIGLAIRRLEQKFRFRDVHRFEFYDPARDQ
ncbi:MAG: hypothetical protein LUF87_01690 [Alistipes sp.]|nr:hypothetical protein [Alistipes sp.]